MAYLTQEGPSPADRDIMPKPVLEAIQQIEKSSEFISLVCMNVIMPTAMITMHTDENLSKSSAETSRRGIIVAKSLMEEEEMKNQCAAILAVASALEVDNSDCKLVKVSEARQGAKIFFVYEYYILITQPISTLS